jgi:hypothetical protein
VNFERTIPIAEFLGLRPAALAHPVDWDALVGERTAMWGTIGSPNQIEAVRANVERRLPRFT